MQKRDGYYLIEDARQLTPNEYGILMPSYVTIPLFLKVGTSSQADLKICIAKP